MAYDKGLAQRVREILEELPGFNEKKMFGGICWLLHGNMAGGIINDDLIVRVGPEKYDTALNQPGTRVFDITGRVMKGWVMVSSTELESDQALSNWMQQGVDFARTLPPKSL